MNESCPFVRQTRRWQLSETLIRDASDSKVEGHSQSLAEK